MGTYRSWSPLGGLIMSALAAGILLASATSALGATAKLQGGPSLTVTAAPGEKNNLSITYQPATQSYDVTDAGTTTGGGPIPVTPADGTCTQVAANQVRCATPFAAQAVLVTQLNDQDDIVSITGLSSNQYSASLLYGGAGNDIFKGGPNYDAYNESPGGGNYDTVDYSGRTDNLTVTMGQGTNDGGAGENENVGPEIENLTTGAGNDTVTGSAGNNVIRTGLGTDTVDGAAGNDTLDGGPGPGPAFTDNDYGDVLIGGAGVDLADYSTHPPVDALHKFSLNYSPPSGIGDDGMDEGHDEHDDVRTENLYATSSPLIVTGDDGPNVIIAPIPPTPTPNLFVNIFFGKGGNDTLVGGTDTNTLYGEGGNDTLIGSPLVSSPGDRFSGGLGNDRINAQDGLADQAIDCGTDQPPTDFDRVAYDVGIDPAPIGCEGSL